MLLIISKLKLFFSLFKLGFSIEPNVFGYGLVLSHFSAIVVGDLCKAIFPITIYPILSK